MAANSVVGRGVGPKFKLIQAFTVVIITCKNEKDPFKMKALEWSQHFSHCKSMGMFFKCPMSANSAVPGQICTNQSFMVVLVTYKNEDDPKLKAQE